MDTRAPAYGFIGNVGLASTPVPTMDRRWLAAAVLITALMMLGIAVGYRTGPTFASTFSARVSLVYCPWAGVLIFFLGWHPRTFPVAAALFYAYLGTAQAANSTFFLAGDLDGALTLEMVLAVPLILTGLCGPPGALPGRSRPVPSLVYVGWGTVLASAVISTVLARFPEIAIPTLFARFVIPILVTLAVFNRLRSVEDYKIIWVGFLLGMFAISAFGFQRTVLGNVPWYQTGVGQRYTAASLSFGIPTLYVVGPALWFGHALAMRKSLLAGVGLLATAALFGLLLWLGAHRSPVFFFGLLVLWWVPGHMVRQMFSLRSLLLALLASVAIAGLVSFSLQRTTYDVGFIVVRFGELISHGLTGEARWAIWTHALQHWASSPIWGVGLNNWVLLDTGFMSIHGSLFGILFDMGVLGIGAFTVLFGSVLWISRKSCLTGLSRDNQEFVLGCRAGWVMMLLLLVVNVTFTSGQPLNNILAYAVFFYPLLAMTVYSRHPQPEYHWTSSPRPEPAPPAALPADSWATATPSGTPHGGPRR